MRQLLISITIIVLASFYVLFLSQIAASSRVIQKVIVIPLFVLLILYYFTNHSWKKLLMNRSKWLLLFLLTLLIQLLVLATGSLSSPFLILIHLCMIGISFIFSFSISLLFLIASFAVILIDLSFNQDIGKLVSENPTPLLLQTASLIPIIPIAYIISRHYHIKDMLSKKLHTQVIADEVILKNLNELIIITDPELRILSVNDAVERTLQQSRFELLNKPIFSLLLMRDKSGAMVNEKTFFPEEKNMAHPKVITDEFTLVRSPFTQRTVNILVKPVQDFDQKVNQISFIISFNNHQSPSENLLKDTLEKARTKYEAMAEYIKRNLNAQSLQEIKMDMIMLQKIESDIYNIQSLKDFPDSNNTTKIDVAQVCKQITQLEQELANVLRVPLEFKIQNFGQKDIAPLVVENFKVSPEQLTGPFFTVSCNVTYLEVTIKKLTEIILLLAATVKDPHATLSIERDKNDDIVVTATSQCPSIQKEDLASIFVPYYGNLYNKTYLYAGSGLEGYLLKSASDASGFLLDVQYKNDPTPLITFTVSIKKNLQKITS